MLDTSDGMAMLARLEHTENMLSFMSWIFSGRTMDVKPVLEKKADFSIAVTLFGIDMYFKF